MHRWRGLPSIFCAGLILLTAGCRAGLDGLGEESGTTRVTTPVTTPRIGILLTTVRSPIAASANVAPASSSKSVGVAPVGKAVVSESPIAGIPAQLVALDGTVLAEATTDGDGVARFSVDPARWETQDEVVIVTATLDAQIQVAQAEVLGPERATCPAGQTVSAATVQLVADETIDIGPTDVASTVAADNTLAACGGSLLQPAGAASGFALGACAPSALIVINEQLANGSMDGAVDTGKEAFTVVTEALRAAIATVQLPGSSLFAAIRAAMTGDAEILATLTQRVDLPVDQAGPLAQQAAAAIHHTFDQNLAESFGATGNWGAAVGCFAQATAEDLADFGKEWSVVKGLMKKAAKKGKVEYFAKKQAVAALAELAKKVAEGGAVDASAAHELAANVEWDAVADGHLTGAALYNTLKTADTPAELALVKENAPAYADVLEKKPETLAKAGGEAVAESLHVKAAEDTAGGKAPKLDDTDLCTADSECAGGEICNPYNECAPAVMKAGASKLELGDSCHVHSECASDNCAGAGEQKFCKVKGDDPLKALLGAVGDSCKNDSQCFSGFCNKKGKCAEKSKKNTGDSKEGSDSAGGADLLGSKKAVASLAAVSECPSEEGEGDSEDEEGGSGGGEVVAVGGADEADGGGGGEAAGGGGDAATPGTPAEEPGPVAKAPEVAPQPNPPADEAKPGGGGGGDGGDINIKLPDDIKMKVGGGGFVGGGGGNVGGGGGGVINNKVQLAPPPPSTDTTPPAVSSSIPADAATRIAVDAPIQFTFSEFMDGATLTEATVLLRDAQDQPVAGTVTSADKPSPRATFTPTKRLKYNAAYTSRVTTGAKDKSGNALPADVVRTFRTPTVPNIIVGGPNHTLAIKSDGTVWAWGSNTRGHLGNGSKTNLVKPHVPTPQQVVGAGGVGSLTDIIAVGAGSVHSVALKRDKSVWTWGGNDNGQIGDNTTGTDRLAPVQVLGGAQGGASVSDIVEICGGQLYTAALDSLGGIWTWGSNFFGQLGDNTKTQRKTPVRVLGAGGVGTLGNVKQIGCGAFHLIALKNDGTVWAWGHNLNGRLGDGTTVGRTTPVQVKGLGGSGFLTDVAAIAAGGAHSLALKSNGTVWAWGLNGNGQLGDTTTTQRATPVQVVGTGGVGVLGDVAGIVGGGLHSMAWKSDGSAWTWGMNNASQLGNGEQGVLATSKTSPIQVHGQNNIGFLSGVIGMVNVTLGDQSFAIADDGAWWGWGRNSSGQLGDGTLTVVRSTPIPITLP